MTAQTYDPAIRAPLVSVVLPTLNGMATLPAVFDALEATEGFTLETVVIDSGSTDGTVELARTRATRVIQIDPAAFDHGLSRNRGLAESTGELVVCLVQDAVPASGSWLRALVSPLVNDPDVAGTWARQIPAPDASALVRFYISRASISSDRPVVNRLRTLQELQTLTPMERLERCRFDNVCSCIRKSVWQAIPFRSVPIAEDLAWALEALAAGYALAYCPDAVVAHSHDRPAIYEYRRTRALHRQLARLFDLETVPSFGALARSVAGCLKLHWAVGQNDAPLRALALAFAWPVGQYLGARDHRTHRSPYRPRGV